MNNRVPSIKPRGNSSWSFIAWKVSVFGVFLVPYFPVFGLNTDISPYSVFGLNTDISPYSVRMGENLDRRNPKRGHFSRSVFQEVVFFQFGLIFFSFLRNYTLVLILILKIQMLLFLLLFFIKRFLRTW